MTLLTPNPYSVQPGQCPVHEVDWWRKRADEIEVQVARTGSREAMACYTQMRGLIQSVASAPPTIVQQALSGKPAQEGE